MGEQKIDSRIGLALLGLCISVVISYVWGSGDYDKDGLSNLSEFVTDIDANGDGSVSAFEAGSAAVVPLGVFLVSLAQAKLILVFISACLLLLHSCGAYRRITSLERKPVFPVQAAKTSEGMLQFLQMELSRAPSAAPHGSTVRASKSDLAYLVKDTSTAGKAREFLDKFTDWNYDIYSLMETTDHPLAYVGSTCLDQFHMQLNEKKLLSFLRNIEDAYKDVPYHNKMHGAYVARAAFSLCKGLGLQNGLSESMQFALVFSGIIHDVGHPGLTAPFLSSINDELSIRYNDVSPLENMHLAVAFGALRKQGNDFMENKALKDLKPSIVAAVLGTDMTRHSEQMVRLESLIDHMKHGGSEGSIPWYWPSKPPLACKTPEGQRAWHQKLQSEFVLEVFLHAADVGTPSMTYDQFMTWNKLIQAEFHAQGDREKAEFGELISARDGYDRAAGAQCHHKFTCGFVNFVVLPLFSKLDELAQCKHEDNLSGDVDLSPCMENLRKNQQLLEEKTPA